jgi:sortase (surface protein transpeptidase)
MVVDDEECAAGTKAFLHLSIPRIQIMQWLYESTQTETMKS